MLEPVHPPVFGLGICVYLPNVTTLIHSQWYMLGEEAGFDLKASVPFRSKDGAFRRTPTQLATLTALKTVCGPLFR